MNLVFHISEDGSEIEINVFTRRDGLRAYRRGGGIFGEVSVFVHV